MAEFVPEPTSEGRTGASRRAFLAGAGLTGVAAAAGSWASPAFGAVTDTTVPGDGAASGAVVDAATSGAIVDLTFDGKSVGSLDSAEGGQAIGELVNVKIGPDHIARKHIAGVKYEDFTVTAGTGMSKSFYNWVKDSFDRNASRKSGAVSAADFKGQVQFSQAFSGALLTEIGFPALDAAAKDAAKMTIKFHPETSRLTLGGGTVPGRQKVQKQWLPSNFRLEIDGLDTTRVSKIEAITIKQSVAPDRDNDADDVLDIPNLSFLLDESAADSWLKWFDDFVVTGNNGQKQERGGKLAYVATDGTALFTLDLFNLGIFKLTPEKVESGTESVRRVKAELYCETIKFTHFLQ